MTPKPQENRSWLNPTEQETSQTPPAQSGDSIVISGMSGLFPMSSSVMDLSEILYNKINPVTCDNVRWSLKHPEATEFIGMVPELDRFDAQFFMVHKRLGDAMDPMARKILEHSFQAIYDAGLSPKELNGKKVGVYIAAAFSDSENLGFFNIVSKTGYGITGTSKTMYANRVSYWLNAKGPSMTLDDACCGSLVALEEAVKAINRGTIESAIVGSANTCLAPHSLVHYNRCIKISSDGKTKSFDQNAAGCSKSEAISVLFIQKASHALRAYAEVVHVKNEFLSRLSGESGQVFGFVRNPDITADFLKKFYLESHVSPKCVEYIEACGSATPEADKAELQSIEKVFCENRSDSLLVGSVISNIGFTDAASGGTAITKVLLGYHNSLIASNLHCDTPRQDIAAIQDGRIRIVTDHQPFRGTYAAVNCLSFTGVNSHVLLRGYSKPKDLKRYESSMPRLVTMSARQTDYLKDIFSSLKSRPIDAEELALIQNIHSNNISGHLGRGYIILDKDQKQKTICLSQRIEHSDEANRPLWFVYSGMGSQWAGMGAQLMRIPIFAAAIQRCHTVLEPKGIDIVNIITSPDREIFDNVLNSFVGIAAVQIGITDILDALGLRPDKIIGHSVGELGCAYADGCLTTEEIILSAYSRGKASNDTLLIKGAMAAVGLGYQKLSTLCPPAIEIACHNSSNSSTISGPEEVVQEFVATLTANGVFAKEVPSANIAYHSRYIADAAPYLSKQLSEVIKKPRVRSERWLSTSVPQERWGERAATHCSAEYLTNNLLSPVLFEETSSLIPANAVLVEIAPHGLLQAILKRALPDSCTNIPLTQRRHKDNALFLLEAVGKLYIEGFNPQIHAIYPKIEFPVSAGTPQLGHLIKWSHSECWAVPSQSDLKIKEAASCKKIISIHDDEHSYLTGNVIQGKILYPFAGALVAVWDTLAMTLGFPKKKTSVQFNEVHLYSQPILHDQKQLHLNISLHRGSGRFEVLDGNSKVASGFITITDEILELSSYHVESSAQFDMCSKEIYKHLSTRGYFYKQDFESINRTGESETVAEIIWKDNWVTFIDGLLQLNALRCSHDGVSQPTHIRNLSIDVKKHEEMVQSHSTDISILKATVDEALDTTRCGGISVKNIKFRNLPQLKKETFKLTTPTTSDNNIAPNDNITHGKHFALQIGNIGEIDSLHWEEAPPVNNENEIKIQVEYAGINILDAKRATGIISCNESEKYYGMDFSGITQCGSRVMGLVRNGAAQTEVSVRPELLWPVPAHWTLEDAATVPLAYSQAFYYLCVKNELQRGWRVLVHGACGALGQAAVSIALAHGCKVFATVSDNAKKRFLLKLFPNLNENCIGNSRDDTFSDMVLNATNGEGCNIILSCVRDDLKNISLKCAAFSGVTIDMVQIQNRDKFEYGMFNMTRQRSYIAANFYSVLESEKTAELKTLQLLVSEGISRGYVVPLTRVTFAPHEAARAFRLLAASRHRGRVLLTLRDQSAPVTPRIVCTSDSIQMIVWDGSLFGLQLVDRLIARGAKKIRIYCLNLTSLDLLRLRLWKKIGADVEVLPNNTTSTSGSDDVVATLHEITQQGSIEGIYLSFTGVKQNNELEKKVTKFINNLDETSRSLQPLLKYFCVITVNSNLGQQTCDSRYKSGFSATALKFYKRVNNLDDNFEESSWNRSAIDILELALRSKHSVLFAQSQGVEYPSLMKMIASVTDITNDTDTLKDLRLEEMLPAINFFLRDVYHVSLNNKDILMLNKKKILEIEMNSTEHNFKEVKGLSVFFSVIDDDELLSTTDLIPMNTIVCNIDTLTGIHCLKYASPIDYQSDLNATCIISMFSFNVGMYGGKSILTAKLACLPQKQVVLLNMMDGGIDASKTHLFIIPGMEGHHARFRTLCERLKLPAMVLQPGLDHPWETPREQADRYSKILLEKFKLDKNFCILGYEFGVIVALELATILEDQGLTGTVYCVGDGPEELRAQLEAELSAFSSTCALEEGVVRHVCSLLSRSPPAELERALRACCSWQQRVECGVRALLGRTPHTAQYVRALLQAAHARVATARRTAAAPRALRSRLVLLRARRDRRDLPPVCSLQRYSRDPLPLHRLAAPLAHAATDLAVPAIVNKYLDRQLLDKFENSNVCETYLL